MPELPEVERAREVIERYALGRRIARIDDSDDYVTRPHVPGEISGVLEGASIKTAHRIGKSMWLEFTDDAPDLGIHLGMSGRIVVDGQVGGDPRFDDHAELGSPWTRFRIDFSDGGYLLLFDKRRLGRVVLEPDLSRLGPDALTITLGDFTAHVGGGSAPLKARLLNQSVIAGIGNLLADQVLWEAKLSPLKPSNELTTWELSRLHDVLIKCTKEAMEKGGVHTGSFMPFRKPGERCPRCGEQLQRTKVGGRTTWWCPKDQGL